MSFGARHRAATKPMPLTSRNSSVKMMISVMWSLMPSPPGGHSIDDRGGHDAEHDEGQLQPVEHRETEQPRRVVVVQRRQQRHHDRDDQQPVPRAMVTAPGGHRRRG